MQLLAGLGAEAHHQRAEVIRRSSPPHAVAVPFTPRDSTGMLKQIILTGASRHFTYRRQFTSKIHLLSDLKQPRSLVQTCLMPLRPMNLTPALICILMQRKQLEHCGQIKIFRGILHV